MMMGTISFVACAWVLFGLWTIGHARRRVIGGVVVVGLTLLFSPFFLVQMGQQYGFLGIQFGLAVIFMLLGGGFFYTALGWAGRPRKIRKVRTLSEDPDLF